MRLLLCFFCLTTALLFAEQPSYISFPSDITWKQKESEHFRVIYAEGQARQGDRALIAAEKAFKTLTTIFPEYPEKTWIVLADFQESTNGYALNFPYPHMVIYTCPPEAGGQLAALDDWFDSIIFHEYTHILHLYPAHGFWKVLRAVFGTIIVPNGLMPSHFHEGMATLMETQFRDGGRGRGTIFSMFRRKAVEANLWGKDFAPLDLLEGSATRWPTGISPYFFGYTLHKELWDRKGKEGLRDLTLSYSSNWPYFFLNGPLKEVYGVNYDQLWKEIYEKGEKEAKTEIEKIKKTPLSKLDYVTDTRHYKWDVTFSPDAKRFVTRSNSPYTKNGFDFYDTQTKKLVKRVEKSTGDTEGICWVKWGGKEYLLYPTQVQKNNYSTKYLAQLEVDSEEEFIYSEDDFALAHLHKIGCHNAELILTAYHENGGVGHLTEYKIDPKEHKLDKTKEWKLPEGSWVTGILVEDSNWFLLRKDLTTSLYRWDKAEPKLELKLPFHAYNLKSGDEENTFLSITSKAGRDEIWEIAPKRNQLTKKVALIGGANAFDYLDKKYVISSYEHGGFDIAFASEVSQGPEKVAVERNTNADAAASPGPSNIETSYSSFGTLLPRTWIPSLLIVPDGIQFGVWVPGFDLSQRHFFDIFAGYDSRGLPFGMFGYNYRFGGKYTIDFNAQYMPSYVQSIKADDKLDKFVKRWGSSLGISAKLWKLPRIRLATLYRKLEENPKLNTEFQSVGVEADLSETWGLKSKPLSVSPTNGVSAYVNYAYFPKDLGTTRNYFTVIAGLDFYFDNPIWTDSVFYLGNKLGYTEGSTFFNSYFEGGGELLFSQGRNLFLNRGYSNGYFIGRRMYVSNIEYRFPITRIDRGWGLYPVHLRKIHGALTFDTISLDSGSQVPDTVSKNFLKNFYSSMGIEIRSDWKVGFYLPALLRFGVYKGLALDESMQFVIGLEAAL